jgi:YVTN family beta-propeller protein
MLAASASLMLVAPGALARQVLVANLGADTVTPVDLATNQAGAPIAVGADPVSIAISPDGQIAYVSNELDGTVSVIEIATDRVIGAPIAVGANPAGLALTPNGATLYVADELSNTVSVIDTASRQAVGSIKVGSFPNAVAVDPDGLTAYVSNAGGDTVSVIDTLTNAIAAPSIPVGEEPLGIAFTPDGRKAFVADGNSKAVTVIDALTNAVEGPPIKVGKEPGAIAVSPDGHHAYVANDESNSVSVIDTGADQVVGTAIKLEAGPTGIAITPNGRFAYVAEPGAGGISPIDLGGGSLGALVPTGETAFAVAIVPDQPPTASFAVGPATAGSPVAFDASASAHPENPIAAYTWNFGDGQNATGGPTITHVYAAPGTYQATLTVDDGEGCPGLVFTGRTASCNGPSTTTVGKAVGVVALPAARRLSRPQVRLHCPQKAHPGGCRFVLQVVAAKPKRVKGKLRMPTPESAVARIKLAPGHSGLVTLAPKAGFAARLEAAKSFLVREVVTLKGKTHTVYRRLKVAG